MVPAQRWLQQTRTVKGGQVAAAGTIGTGAIGRPFCEKFRLVDAPTPYLPFAFALL